MQRGIGMEQGFAVKGRMAGLNEYTAANRAHWSLGAQVKKNETEKAMWAIRAARLKPFEKPVSVAILWAEKGRMRDPDNVAFAAKFIMDALVKTGTIPDDGQKWVRSITNEVAVDKDNPRVEVRISDE